MKQLKVIISIFVFFNTFCYGQTINIHSISTNRQPTGDHGYTLDGERMKFGSRLKLLNTSNFGSTGTYSKSISIFDGYTVSGSLTAITAVPADYIFFFGSFNVNDTSTKQFTSAEVDSLYNWSSRGGKLIICTTPPSVIWNYTTLYKKWGFSTTPHPPGFFIPNDLGNSTDIYNGPFGNVPAARQGAQAQGYFNLIPGNSKILATDSSGNTTLFMDCNTLDLVIADVDGYTELGGVSYGPDISNAQDKFWANTIVFMDRLQPKPVITIDSNILSVDPVYNGYQWLLNNAYIDGAVFPTYAPCENGNYSILVAVNGGCKIKSGVINLNSLACQDSFAMPNVFTPNNDGLNDLFIPITLDGFIMNQISIYNRWGMLVHKNNSQSILWDGKINDEAAADGVYYWILEYKNSCGCEYVRKGYVQLTR